MLTTSFGPDFIQRTLKSTGMLLIISFLFGIMYFGFYDALALLTAGVWSMVNMIFLSSLIRVALRPDGVDKLAAAGIALIKFPLLYGVGYFIFTTHLFRPIPLLLGISSVLIVMVLKAVSRAILKIDVNNHESSSRGLA